MNFELLAFLDFDFYDFSPPLFLCFFACDLIWICFLEGFQEGERGDTGGVGEKMNQCEKEIKLHSYEKQKKTEIFMENKCSFLEKKKQQPVAK